MTEQFQDLYNQRSMQYEKPQASIINQWLDIDANYDNANAYDLIKAMNKCLQRYKIAQPYQVSITKKSLTVDQRKMILKDKIQDVMVVPILAPIMRILLLTVEIFMK